MKVLGFRFCQVSPEAAKLATFLDAIGFERHPLEGGSGTAEGSFTGAVFAAGESWLAMWPPSADMPSGLMLQVVVDDADAFADRAREQGLNPVGPTDSQNKRLYFLQAPTGFTISLQSKLPGQREESLPAPPPAQPKLSNPPPAPMRTKSPAASAAPPRTAAARPPTTPAHLQRPGPSDAAIRRIQTVVLPPAGSKGFGPPPPAQGRPRNNAAPPPPPVVARRVPR